MYPSLINKIFNSKIGRNTELYFDDMLVKFTKLASHISKLEETFSIMRKYWKKLNPSKCAYIEF